MGPHGSIISWGKWSVKLENLQDHTRKLWLGWDLRNRRQHLRYNPNYRNRRAPVLIAFPCCGFVAFVSLFAANECWKRRPFGFLAPDTAAARAIGATDCGLPDRGCVRRVRWHCPQEGSDTLTDRLLDETELTISEGIREMACRLNQDASSFQKTADNLWRTAQTSARKLCDN